MGNNPSRNSSATTTPRASSSRRLFQAFTNQSGVFTASGTSYGDEDSQSSPESAAGNGAAAVKPQTPPLLEYVDGGQTNSIGKLYPGIPDYDMNIVKKFIMEKRLAPFFSPLDDVASVDSAEAAYAKSADDNDKTSVCEVTEGQKDVNIDGRSDGKEVDLIRSPDSDNPMECPICFMQYPPYFNYTKCCDQPICTECFIQIKRPESTFDPAPCPYCQTPNLSILYQSKEMLAKNLSISLIITRNINESVSLKNIVESPTASDSKEAPIPSVVPVNANIELLKHIAEPPAENAQNIIGAGDAAPAAAVSRAPSASFSRRQSNHPVLTSDDIRPDWRERKQKIELDRILAQQRIALATARRRQMDAFSNAEITNAALFAAQLYEGSAGNSGSRNQASRSFRNGAGRRNDETQNQYVRAMRYLGADVEELMLLEAMRRSMQDTSTSSAVPTASDAPPPIAINPTPTSDDVASVPAHSVPEES